ncbi:MAG: modification methylase HindIII [Candidatus Woesearchaeota archaeon]|nr:MAG: modification methylase HindIII [Candidatus Woesearchaeota archaeon]
MRKTNKIPIEQFLNRIINGKAEDVLKEIPSDSIDIVITDPPYFLDRLDSEWNDEKINNENNQRIVKSLPAGMKFDKRQGLRLYEWYYEISKEIYRVLKSGGFFFSFSSPRLYHRMASSVEDAGFEIRDFFIWLYTRNQVKAMSMNHFIDKLNIEDKQKNELKKKLNGWKTPQIKSCFEPIVVAQKPKSSTFLQNMIEHEVGLFNTRIPVGKNFYPANIMSIEEIDDIIDHYFLIEKPSKKEKGNYNYHKTVKPIKICEHLIKLCAYSKNAIVLDPFIGSGTTAIGAKNLGIFYIGIEVNSEYVKIAEKRLNTS